MHEDLRGLRVVILIEDLEVHYCDPLTMETEKVKRFKTEEDLDKYLTNPKK